MLRLTLMLCIGLFAALMIAGEDRGQLRPGLAEAPVWKMAPRAVAVTETDSVDRAAQTEPVTELATASAPKVEQPVLAAANPAPYVEPTRKLVTEVKEPVFSLASLGNEPVPGATDPRPVPETPDGGMGTIWYVVANAVNVRAEPSTSAEIVGRLGSGEATLVVQSVNDQWARIVIQGDGVEGFVAMRYLSPEAP